MVTVQLARLVPYIGVILLASARVDGDALSEQLASPAGTQRSSAVNAATTAPAGIWSKLVTEAPIRAESVPCELRSSNVDGIDTFQFPGVQVTGAAGDDQAIYFSTDAGLIRSRDGRSELFRVPHSEQAMLLPWGTLTGTTELVDDVLRARDGQLWVATPSGAFQVSADGSQWQSVSRSGDSIPRTPRGMVHALLYERGVTKLCELTDGQIAWAGHRITLVQGDRYSAADFSDDFNEHVTSIVSAGKDRLFISVRGMGVYEARIGAGGIEHCRRILHRPHVFSLALDHKENLWVGSLDGLEIISRGIVAKSFTEADGLPDSGVCDVSVDQLGRVWAITMGGIAIYEKRQWWVPDGDIDASGSSDFVKPAGESHILVGTLGRAFRVDVRKLKLRKSLPKADRIAAQKARIAADWPAISEHIGSVSVTDHLGRLITSFEGRLFRFDGKMWEDLTDRLGEALLCTAYCDSQGVVWLGTNQGPFRLDGDQVRRVRGAPFDTVVYCIAESKDRVIYFGTQMGVIKLHNDVSQKVTSDEFQVSKIFVDPHRRIWFLDIDSGLHVFHEGILRSLMKDPPLVEARIADVVQEKDGKIVVTAWARVDGLLQPASFSWDATQETLGKPARLDK